MATDPRMRFTIALIGVVTAQSIAALLWAGAAAERLSQLEQRVDRTQQLIERTARLEEQAANIRLSLARIERKLDDARNAE